MCAQLCKELGAQYLDFQGLNKNRNEMQAEEDSEILWIMGEQGPTEAGRTSRVYYTCSENDLPESALDHSSSQYLHFNKCNKNSSIYLFSFTFPKL